MSSSKTVASCPAYRFLRRQVRWFGISTDAVIHTVKVFSLVCEAEVDVFLEFPCFPYPPTNFGNFILGSSALSKSSLYIWKFSIHILMNPGLKYFEHYFANMWNEHNCTVLWAFFGTALLWDWSKTWPFPVLWPLLSFPNLLTQYVEHFNYTCLTAQYHSLRF